MATAAEHSHRTDHAALDGLSKLNIEDADNKRREMDMAQGNFTMIQFFEWYAPGKGVHWKKYEQEAPRLADMGITAAWLPPPTKGSSIDGTGYDIYDLYDLGEFDQKGGVRTNWGTKEELLNAIKVAKDNGIISYIDAVLNHRLGADEKQTFKAIPVDENNRNKTVGEAHDIEGWTKYTFNGRGDKYSTFKYGFEHFTGVDYDDKTGDKGIFKIVGENKGWAQAVDKENQNYDYLMGADVDHAHPDVEKDNLLWGDWVLKETGASGFRFDAIKHIDENFIQKFVKHVRKEANNDSLFMVGEFWKDDIDTINKYLDRMGTQFSVFDAPLHYNFKEAGEAGVNYDLRKIFDGTLTQARAMDSVTLVDNHDTQVGQSLESWVSPQFKPIAYSMILLRVDGYPCVFFGDLYGCGGENPQEPVTQLDDMIRARKYYSYGHQIDYFDHPQCVGWVRQGTEKRPDGCATVCCIGDAEGTKRMEVGALHAGEAWTDVLGWSQGEVTIGEDGFGEFKSPAHSVSIWVKKDAEGRDKFSKAQ